MLAQPIDAALERSRRVLIAGCGGGYDVLGGVPLGHALERAGKEVHYASLSFSYLNGLDGTIQCPTVPNLYQIPSSSASMRAYSPEAWILRELEARVAPGRPSPTMWGFDKTGVPALTRAYRELVTRLDLDTIILVDGGIDALLRGDETSLGTPAEDLASVAAVHSLNIPTKILACVGLGAELRDGIAHEQVFARIAELNQRSALLGTELLLPGTPAGDLYLAVHAAVLAGQQAPRNSHVHKLVSASMRGEYGSDGPYVRLGPWLHQFWYFDLDTVARTHLFLESIVDCENIVELNLRIEAIREELTIRERSRLDL